MDKYAIIDRKVRFASDSMTLKEAEEMLKIFEDSAEIVSVGVAREFKQDMLKRNFRLKE